MQGQLIHVGNDSRNRLFVLNRDLYVFDYDHKHLSIVGRTQLVRSWLSIFQKITPDLDKVDVYDLLKKLEDFLSVTNSPKKYVLVSMKNVYGCFFSIPINSSSSLILKHNFEFTFSFNDNVRKNIRNDNETEFYIINKKVKINKPTLLEAFSEVEECYRNDGQSALDLI